MTQRPCLGGCRDTGTANLGQSQSPFNLISPSGRLVVWGASLEGVGTSPPAQTLHQSLRDWLWFCLPMPLFFIILALRHKWIHVLNEYHEPGMIHCLPSQMFAIIQPPTPVTCEHNTLPLTQKGSSKDKSAPIICQWIAWRHVAMVNLSPLLLHKIKSNKGLSATYSFCAMVQFMQ